MSEEIKTALAKGSQWREQRCRICHIGQPVTASESLFDGFEKEERAAPKQYRYRICGVVFTVEDGEEAVCPKCSAAGE